MALDSWFLSPAGLLAALALLPLILLYLFKPRPRKQVLPSLMFLLGDKGSKSKRLFLWYMLQDLLLLLHLLLLIALILALARPYVLVDAHEARGDTIIVLDGSGSMLAGDRATQARQLALQQVSEDNTIIIAGAGPSIVAQDVSASRARDIISAWRPTPQRTSLGRALLSAGTMVGGETRVAIISDFADNDESTDWKRALGTLRARGAAISLHQVTSEETSNVALIDAAVTETTTTIFIANLGTTDEQRTLCAGSTCTEIGLEAGRETRWSFQTPPGITRVELTPRDDYPVDDEVLISAPEKQDIKVLVVTNEDFADSPLAYALETIDEATSLDITTTINKPPALATVEHDVIILKDIDAGLLVSRTIRDTTTAVSQGAAAIIVAQDDLFGMSLGALMPHSFVAKAGAAPVLNTNTQASLVGIDFGDVARHLEVAAAPGTQVLAETPQGHPIITLGSLQNGRVLYYGLQSGASSFADNPQYPVFWKRILDELLVRPSPDTLNRRTGAILTAAGTITLPDGSTAQGSVVMSDQGIYETSRGRVVANMRSAEESRLATPGISEDPAIGSYATTTSKEPLEFTRWLLLLVIVLIFAETLYLRWRGDL